MYRIKVWFGWEDGFFLADRFSSLQEAVTVAEKFADAGFDTTIWLGTSPILFTHGRN